MKVVNTMSKARLNIGYQGSERSSVTGDLHFLPSN